MAASRAVQRIRVAMQAAVDRTVRATALEVAHELVKATPVDTGWARANWVPSIDAPDLGVGGTVESVAAHQQTAMAIVATARGVQKAFVTNGVPYIRRLTAGHSKQAPAGFDTIAITIAVNRIRGGGLR